MKFPAFGGAEGWKNVGAVCEHCLERMIGLLEYQMKPEKKILTAIENDRNTAVITVYNIGLIGCGRKSQVCGKKV